MYFISFIDSDIRITKKQKKSQQIMKYPTKTNTQQQQQQQQPEQPQHPQLSQSSDSLSNYELSLQQIVSACHIINKIKKIKKDNLTKFKKKYKEFNGLYCVMSDLFVCKKNIGILVKKKMREERKEQRKKTTICKKSETYNKILQNMLKQQKALEQKNYPEIIQSEQLQQQSPQSQNQQSQSYLNQISHLSQNTALKSTCYVCLQKYTQIDDIYHKHCPSCAKKDKQKRLQSYNLSGMTALVTGARIKIGYQITLKLLRDGAKVYATTRFVADALLRYQREEDYCEWKDRIFLVQCDFLSSEQVNMLIKYMKENVEHLDILVHNAAQTIVRPAQFFTSQLQHASNPPPPSPNIITFTNKSTPSIQHQPQKFLTNSTITSQQVDLTKRDEFNQPLDLRNKNTWRQKIEDVSLFDCMSTQVINATVPFFITGQLRCIMGGDRVSYVVNVSSMEGVFYRGFKSCFHPHTNMAKASLNMMTRTCAGEMAKNNIYMNSVDTGWVTNQNPIQITAKMNVLHDFTPPLDCIDGAMRVLDPIYQGVRDHKYIYGKFLKNYEESFW